VREYEEGDDPRAVDWNVTARMGRPFVKTYVDERELTVLFLLDLSASMRGGFGPWSARQMAARVCACLALSASRNDDKVGLIAFSDAVDRFVPPKKGVGHVLRIVRDPETGDETVADWSDPRVRDAYAARVAAWRAQVADDLRRAKVDRMDVPLPRVPDRDAVARPILRFFRMRERRGEKR